MNKVVYGVLRCCTLYAKMEIVGGLILVIVVLGYTVLTNYDRQLVPSVERTSPTPNLRQ